MQKILSFSNCFCCQCLVQRRARRPPRSVSERVKAFCTRHPKRLEPGTAGSRFCLAAEPPSYLQKNGVGWKNERCQALLRTQAKRRASDKLSCQLCMNGRYKDGLLSDYLFSVNSSCTYQRVVCAGNGKNFRSIYHLWLRHQFNKKAVS